jgi:hypothetical protein
MLKKGLHAEVSYYMQWLYVHGRGSLMNTRKVNAK